MVRVKQLVLLFIFCIGPLLSSCNRMQQNRYYRYYVGTMKIENPVLVEFEELDDKWYVCPDSALYCCNDSNWLQRNDVFPYVSVVEMGEPVMTYFPRKQLSHLAFFMYKYPSYYEYSRQHNYIVHYFYYDLNMFECYMEATDIFMFDNLVDVDFDFSDSQSSRTDDICSKSDQFTYRFVVHERYSIFQIIRLKMKYPKPILVDTID